MTHRERFYRSLARLSSVEFAEFVATLYRARGRDVRVEATDDGPTVVVDGRRLRVHSPGRWRWRDRLGVAPVMMSPSADGVDGVVTTAPDPRWSERSGTVVDAGTIYDWTVYGVPGPTRRRLLSRLDLPGRTVGDTPGRDRRLPGGGGRGWRLLAGVVAALLIVAGVGASVGEWGPPGDVRGSDVSSAAGELGEAPVTPFAPSTPTTATPVPPDAFPPGVGAGGVTDPGRLAEAHYRTLRGRSYRLSIVYRETPRRGIAGILEQTIEVAGPTRYVLRRSVSAEVNFGATNLISIPRAYADGDRRYVLLGGAGASRYRSRPVDPSGADRYARRIAGYLAEVLDGNRSELLGTFVRNGTRYFRLRVTGAGGPAKRGVVARATVDADGTVHRLRRWYELDEVAVTVTLRYDFGAVSVEPPAWYREGKETDPGAPNRTDPASATAG